MLSFLFFAFFNIFIGVKLLYNGVLVSAVKQSKSAIHIHMSPYLFPLAPPSHPPYPTPLGGHKAPSWSPLSCTFNLHKVISPCSSYGLSLAKIPFRRNTVMQSNLRLDCCLSKGAHSKHTQILLKVLFPILFTLMCLCLF